MKKNRLFLLIALAAMFQVAVTSCDSPRRSSGGDDESDEKSEKVEKKPTIKGKYKTTINFSDVIEGENAPIRLNGDMELNFKDKGVYEMDFDSMVEVEFPQINNSVIFETDVEGEGSWNYDESTGVLTYELEKCNIDIGDFSVKKQDQYGTAILNQLRGQKDLLKEEFRKSIFDGPSEINVTKVTKKQFEGTINMSGTPQSVVFKKVK